MLSNRVISANIETTCRREINNKMQVSKELCTQIGLGNPTESEDSIVVLVMGFHYDKR
jgi:hypothetical protein